MLDEVRRAFEVQVGPVVKGFNMPIDVERRSDHDSRMRNMCRKAISVIVLVNRPEESQRVYGFRSNQSLPRLDNIKWLASIESDGDSIVGENVGR